MKSEDLAAVRGKEICRVDVATCPQPVVAKNSKDAEVFYIRMKNSTRSVAAEDVAYYVSSREGRGPA